MREINPKHSGNIPSRLAMFYNFTMSFKNHKPAEPNCIQHALFYGLLNDNKVTHLSYENKTFLRPMHMEKDHFGGVFGFKDIISAGMHAGDVGVHV